MCRIDDTISRANSIDLDKALGRDRNDTCKCNQCPCCGKPYSAGHPMPTQPWDYRPASPYSPNRMGPSDFSYRDFQGQGDFPFGDLMGLYIPKTTC